MKAGTERELRKWKRKRKSVMRRGIRANSSSNSSRRVIKVEMIASSKRERMIRKAVNNLVQLLRLRKRICVIYLII